MKAGLKYLIVAVIYIEIISGSAFANEKESMSGRPIERVVEIVRGHSMLPLIEPGEEIVLLKGYYRCYEPKIEEIVAYDYAGNEAPLIKIIKATFRDEVKIKEKRLWINSEVMKNSRGEEYLFSPCEVRILSLYIKNKHLPEKCYLIFGDNVRDSLDSRRFGAVSRNDMPGKFQRGSETVCFALTVDK